MAKSTEQIIAEARRVEGQDWRVAAVIVLGELGTRIKEARGDIQYNELENPGWNLSTNQAIAEAELDMLMTAFKQLKEILADDLKAVING